MFVKRRSVQCSLFFFVAGDLFCKIILRVEIMAIEKCYYKICEIAIQKRYCSFSIATQRDIIIIIIIDYTGWLLNFTQSWNSKRDYK